jgi:hypothetical protein
LVNGELTPQSGKPPLKARMPLSLVSAKAGTKDVVEHKTHTHICNLDVLWVPT